MSIETPCVKVCVLDPVTGYCIGCGRSGPEIGGWIGMGAEARRRVMADLPARLETMPRRETRGRRRNELGHR